MSAVKNVCSIVTLMQISPLPFVWLGFGALPEMVRKKRLLLGIDFSISNNNWSEKPAEVCWARISFVSGLYSSRRKACSVGNWQLSAICFFVEAETLRREFGF